ncbi:hypothetical protein [Coprothermobacter platensis]|uniref:hypothetical protein n=1 Tax=Coprothermobacter platensis TaxID=108819 RepID=UPI00036F178B|nr:hypothetical protein [Coprothermobacter platensis]
MAEIIACGNGGLYDFLSFSGINVMRSEQIDAFVSRSNDTVVLVTDGIACDVETLTQLEEKYPAKFIPVVLDPKQGVDVSSAKKFVERALGIKLDR